ncbi:HflK [Buchnera aphidicola str. Bp (Baizongia pistaciae)]|uniref:Protein HflK n=1 Tax=Buchnera aphidicola subsp. Baizongia pistaciae (strain Bp) TaxID=224915 RepID=HFLK_BUCBP|nr:FtsH protease activity modulator HflK [Buchnera aphidicola]Q89A39.1 RecName: Full=Protein HflK [Buchnera aphidicola str. Bp (Baizongia pistaciae)]AAO27216.1 HflK [Buchnera aphidicola str. Bp (Baizongia pistaciae)]
MEKNMAWNEPSDSEKDKDPWNKKDKKLKNFDENKKSKLYLFLEIECLVNFLKRKKKIFFSESGSFKYFKNLITMIIFTTIIFLIGSGFYFIQESEYGVVTCFGKFSYLANPGLHWKPILIQKVIPIDVSTVREINTSGTILTYSEHFVQVNMTVQYRIVDPKKYLFSVTNPDNCLRQSINSALRSVISRSNIDIFLKNEFSLLAKNDIKVNIQKIIKPYHMGIVISDINFRTLYLPQAVKLAFEDIFSAIESKKQSLNEARIYSNEIKSQAFYNAKKILIEAKSDRLRTILNAQGIIFKFLKILPIYKSSKKITTIQLYFDCMEKIFSHTRKVLTNSDNNFFLFSLNDLFLKNNYNSLTQSHSNSNKHSSMLNTVSSSHVKSIDHVNSNNLLISSNNIINQRKLNSFRKDYLRIGRE